MGKVFLPPERTPRCYPKIDVFLAGSIEMGKAEDWQTELGQHLSKMDEVGNVYNPRRKDWDSSWEQSINNFQFNQQVTWELDHLEKADIIFFNFIPDTMSPITLAELGYALGSNLDMVVCCPDGFWRQGNIEIMCGRQAVTMYRNYTQAVGQLTSLIMRRYKNRLND